MLIAQFYYSVNFEILITQHLENAVITQLNKKLNKKHSSYVGRSIIICLFSESIFSHSHVGHIKVISKFLLAETCHMCTASVAQEYGEAVEEHMVNV